MCKMIVSRSASGKRGNFVPFCCFLSLATVYKYKLRSSSMRDRSFYLLLDPQGVCLCERANRHGYSEGTRRNAFRGTKLSYTEMKARNAKDLDQVWPKQKRESNRSNLFDSIVLIFLVRRISKGFFLFLYSYFFFFSLFFLLLLLLLLLFFFLLFFFFFSFYLSLLEDVFRKW